MIYKLVPYPIVLPGQKCNFDIYVKIKDEYRLFAARGAVFNEEHRDLFSKTHLHLYVSSGDYEAAERYLDNHLTTLLVDPNVNPQVKVDLVYSSSIKSIRDVFEGTNLRTISELEKISEKVVKAILSDSRVMDDLI
ncbi:hypothetical protein EG833_01780, partial [archaeon]|nr:hypothetical protein [archaeon]